MFHKWYVFDWSKLISTSFKYKPQEKYIPLSFRGDGFRRICEYLPFESVVTLIRGISSNNVSIITPRNIIIVVMYTVITFILSTYLFNKNMLSDNK